MTGRRSASPLLAAQAPALLFYNALGDHLLSLPAIRALASAFAGELAFVGYEAMPGTFFPEVRFRRVVSLCPDARPESREPLAPEWVASALGSCDLFLSLNRSSSPALVRLLERLAPSESIGFFPEFRTRLPFPGGRHCIDQAFDVAHAVDPTLRLSDFCHPPVLPSDGVTLSKSVRLALPSGCRLVAVHADTKADKTWPLASFANLLDRFLARHRDFFALVVGGRDLGLKTGRHASRIVSCIGLTLPSSMSLVGAADLFVGVDSLMLHAADLFRVPGVGLFGASGRPREFGFRLAPHRHVVADGPIDTLDPEDVLESIEDLLADAEQRSPRSPCRMENVE